jgi:hypothetical protein
MVATVEALEAAEWLQAVLSADSALDAAAPAGVWSQPAPDDQAGVWVTHQLQSDTTVRTATNAIIWSNMMWLVRAWVEGRSYTPLKAAAARIQTVLDATRSTPVASPNGGLVYCAYREEGWMAPEVDGGREFRSLGGIYRIELQLP